MAAGRRLSLLLGYKFKILRAFTLHSTSSDHFFTFDLISPNESNDNLILVASLDNQKLVPKLKLLEINFKNNWKLERF